VKFLVILILLYGLPSFAADSIQSQLLAVDSAFVQGEYPQVELLTLRLLQGNPDLTSQERSHLNLTAAYALIMMNRETEAREYFRNALDAEPDLTLDPVQVSPKFRMVFDEVKSSYSAKHDNATPLMARQPVHQPPAQRIMLTNLIIPGSGQWREGRRLRGAAYFLAQAAAVGVLVWRIDEMRDSHSDYLAQTNPQRISDRYDTYNRDYNLAWGAGILTGLVYLAAQADLILSRPASLPVQMELGTNSTPSIKLSVHW
jgi:hypothetical protein